VTIGARVAPLSTRGSSATSFFNSPIAASTSLPRQLAAEAREQVEEAELSLSIREVYRNVARALHPDRETDPQELSVSHLHAGDALHLCNRRIRKTRGHGLRALLPRWDEHEWPVESGHRAVEAE
jgi:hypothetical protein